MYLVLVPANTASPHTPLRRAAIDLIGRGFLLWEPHLEVSKVLLGLLDMSSEAALWVPSQKYGLPLTPVADCCRTARHTLSAIATARPGVFITSVSKEIARYNTMATNSQTLNINLQMHVLSRSKAEILHVVEQLIATDTALPIMRDLLTDVVDIILHCVDHNHLKARPISEVFPPIQTFNQVSFLVFLHHSHLENVLDLTLSRHPTYRCGNQERLHGDVRDESQQGPEHSSSRGEFYLLVGLRLN